MSQYKGLLQKQGSGSCSLHNQEVRQEDNILNTKHLNKSFDIEEIKQSVKTLKTQKDQV